MNDRYFGQTNQRTKIFAETERELTDAECDEFRRTPLSFNDMLRAVYRAGCATTPSLPAAQAVEGVEALKAAAKNLIDAGPMEAGHLSKRASVYRTAEVKRLFDLIDAIDLALAGGAAK